MYGKKFLSPNFLGMCSLNPTLSLLIPVYKNHGFAIECISSALIYSDEFIEIIIVDDCPEDPLSSFWPQVSALSDRLKYTINNVNIGRAKTYNLLLSMALGDFYLMLDGDDLLYNAINFSRIKSILSNDKNISILSGRCIEFDKYGTIRWSGQKNKFGIVSGLEYYQKWITIAEVLPHSASIIKRDAAIELGGYPLSYISSDVALVKKLLIIGDLYLVDSLISSWRYHGGNTSKTINTLDLVNNIDHILEPSNLALELKVISPFYIFLHNFGLTKSYIFGCCHQFLAADDPFALLILYKSIFIKYKSNFSVIFAALYSLVKALGLIVLRFIITKRKFRVLMSRRGNYLYR